RRHGSRRGTPPVVTVRKGDTVQRPRFHPHGYPAIGPDAKVPTPALSFIRRIARSFSRTLRVRVEARSEDNPAKRNEIQVARRGEERRGKGGTGIAAKAAAEKNNGREASFLIYQHKGYRPVCDLPRNGWATLENRQRQRLPLLDDVSDLHRE
ncbi:hypothetical protein V1478_001208, partial [Vespula squamosa]